MMLILFILQLTILTDRADHPISIHSEYVSAKYLTSEINTEFIMLTEQFKPIKGYEGLYEISNFGRVKSLERTIKNTGTFGGHNLVKEKILKFLKDDWGYLMVRLYLNGKGKTQKIHTLVWDAFGDTSRDSHNLQVDHKNENKENCRIDNLQLLTNRQNISKAKLFYKKNNLPTGVSWSKSKRKYIASIRINNKAYNLGGFDTIIEASTVYQNKLRTIL